MRRGGSRRILRSCGGSRNQRTAHQTNKRLRTVICSDEQEGAHLGSQKDCNAELRSAAGLREQLGEHNAGGCLGGFNYRLRGRLWR